MTRLLLTFLLLAACAPEHPPTDASATDAGILPPGDGGFEVDASDAPATSDAPDAADAPSSSDRYTPEGFARAAGELICEAWARCPRCSVPAGDCPAVSMGSVIHDPADFDPERVDAYIELLASAYAVCEQVTALEHASLYPYWGDGVPRDPPEDGDACTSPDDCTTRNCQPVGARAERRCVPLPADAPRGSLCL